MSAVGMDLECCPLLFHCAGSLRLSVGSDVLTAYLFWKIGGWQGSEHRCGSRVVNHLKCTLRNQHLGGAVGRLAIRVCLVGCVC